MYAKDVHRALIGSKYLPPLEGSPMWGYAVGWQAGKYPADSEQS